MNKFEFAPATVKKFRRIDLASPTKETRAELEALALQIQAMLQDLEKGVTKVRVPTKPRPSKGTARPSPLDQLIGEMKVTADLRADSGNLSAERVADLFGLSYKRLAELLQKTRQGVHRTPDADSLQVPLEYFERIARLRAVVQESPRDRGASFRKWLKARNAQLGGERPIDWIYARRWQALADLVDDILTGSPS